MIVNPDKLFYSTDGDQYMLLIDLGNGMAIASKASDIGGGGNPIPVYLVEKP